MSRAPVRPASNPAPPGLSARFVDACEQFADRPALDDGLTTRTYAQLLGDARAIAALVVERVPECGVVAVVTTKTAWAVAAAFGVALGGRTALLLDPADPDTWWAERCAQVDARLILADDPVLVVRTAAIGGVPRAGPGDAVAGSDCTTGAVPTESDAWILCTSGSTGAPKFVWNTDGALGEAWDRLAARTAAWASTGDHVLVLPPLAFSAARVPLFQALSAGACAVLVETARTPPGRIVELAATRRTPHLYCDPAMLRVLCATASAAGVTLTSVKSVEVAGAAVDPADFVAARERFPSAVLTMHYGSTELGTVSTVAIGPGDDPGAPGALAGRLGAGIRASVRGDADEMLPAGVVGNLWIASDHGRGEYHDDELDRSTTVTGSDGMSWIRTGDRACLLADGRLELHGRDDERVKVNGVPIDLNVVAAAVRRLPAVADATVTAIEHDSDARLVAWIVMAEDRRPTVRELRAGIEDELPRSMQPHLFRAVGEIPRTPRGKVDRMALRDAAARELPIGVPHVRPRTPTERALADRYRRALGVDDVGVHESFFELGGDSLDALELVTAVVSDFALTPHQETLAEQAMVTGGSVAALAAAIETTTAPRADGPAELRSDGVVRLALRDDGGPDATPIVLLPGGGQTPVALRPLAARLPGQRVWTLVPPGFRTAAVRDRTIHDIAGRFADALLDAHPRGDFVVAGFSFGALVAHDLARIVVERGGRIHLLALLDCDCPGTRTPAAPPRLVTRLRRHWRRVPANLWRRVRAGRRRGAIAVEVEVAEAEEGPPSAMDWAGTMIPTFRLGTTEVPTLVVMCAQAAAAGRPPDRGWATLCRGPLETITVPGTHMDVLREPAVARIGELVAAAAVT